MAEQTPPQAREIEALLEPKPEPLPERKPKPRALKKAIAPGDAPQAEASKLAVAAGNTPAKAKKPVKRRKAEPAQPKKETEMTAETTKAAEQAQAETAKTATHAGARAQDMTADMQQRMKSGYEKASDMTQEAAQLQQGHVEALVESSRILAEGMQEMGREAMETGKSAMETATADMKRAAAIKSPTELFQLQGEIARRNMDAMIGLTSKNVERSIKLANDSFAPITNRMSVAAEKVAQAA